MRDIHISVFAGCVFTLMAGAVAENIRWQGGADVTAKSRLFDSHLNADSMRPDLQRMKSEGTIVDFSCAFICVSSAAS
jgi:hypothetical protein